MKGMIFQEKVKILGREKLGAGYFRLSLFSRRIAASARPGQFVEIKAGDADVPLLRRPLGVHRVKPGVFEVLCQVVGKGTQLLSQKIPGDLLDVIGPLGNGFDHRPAAGKRQKPVIVAGGMGVAPLLFLAEKIKPAKPLVLLGAKTKSHILCAKEFKKLGCAVRLATDDGSAGFKGRITDLLKKELLALSGGSPVVYACGPYPMLKALSQLVSAGNIAAQLSLEAHMSCGFGACLGCVVNTKGGYKRVCKEGPVFSAGEIIWDR